MELQKWEYEDGQTLASKLHTYVKDHSDADVNTTVLAFKTLPSLSVRGYLLGFVHETQAELTDWQVKVLYPIDSLDGHWREPIADDVKIMNVKAATFLWTALESSDGTRIFRRRHNIAGGDGLPANVKIFQLSGDTHSKILRRRG